MGRSWIAVVIIMNLQPADAITSCSGLAEREQFVVQPVLRSRAPGVRRPLVVRSSSRGPQPFSRARYTRGRTFRLADPCAEFRKRTVAMPLARVGRLRWIGGGWHVARVERKPSWPMGVAIRLSQRPARQPAHGRE